MNITLNPAHFALERLAILGEDSIDFLTLVDQGTTLSLNGEVIAIGARAPMAEIAEYAPQVVKVEPSKQFNVVPSKDLRVCTLHGVPVALTSDALVFLSREGSLKPVAAEMSSVSAVAVVKDLDAERQTIDVKALLKHLPEVHRAIFDALKPVVDARLVMGATA